jgi:hypothetical protein
MSARQRLGQKKTGFVYFESICLLFLSETADTSHQQAEDQDCPGFPEFTEYIH